MPKRNDDLTNSNTSTRSEPSLSSREENLSAHEKLSKSLSELGKKHNLRTTPTLADYWKQFKVIAKGAMSTPPESPNIQDKERAALHKYVEGGNTPVSGVNYALAEAGIPLDKTLRKKFANQHADHDKYPLNSPQGSARSIAHEHEIQKGIDEHSKILKSSAEAEVKSGTLTPEAAQMYRDVQASETMGFFAHKGLAAVKGATSPLSVLDEQGGLLDMMIETEKRKMTSTK